MNFKSLREDKLKLSLEEFSNIYQLTFEEVQELDNGSIDPRFDLIQKISQNSGLDFNTICSYEKPKVKIFEAKDTWKNVDFTKLTICNYLNNALEEMNISTCEREKYIDDLKQGIKNSFNKPCISIVGRSDTGKSTLINSLLGQDKMPASWTPTTSIAVYIKHIKDRPDFVKDDVWIFKNKNGDENIWDSKKLNDEDYCLSWKIAAGEADLLTKYGIRQGDNHAEAGSAVIFVDSPVLLNCDILDLPGFGTETDSDDVITFEAAQKTDILIYLSQANGFMRIEDITYLKENVRNLPVFEKKNENKLKPLSNLFIVASQAHTVNSGNLNDLDRILNTGCDNFIKTLSDDYWILKEKSSDFGGYQNNFLRSRFFTYTTDIPSLCDSFNSQLRDVLEQLPNIVNEKAKTFVKEYVSVRKPELDAELNKYNDILKNREKYLSLLDEIDKNELQRIADNDNQKNLIRNSICEYKKSSISDFTEYVETSLNIDAIAGKIKKEKVKNKKEDIQRFASKLQDEIQMKAEGILKNKSEILAKEIQAYIDNFENSIKSSFEKTSISVGFDVTYAFASSLSKIGIIGGLGAWATANVLVFAGLSPFCGAYFLLNFMLGPIGILIGLAIAAVLGVLKLFTNFWEKSIAKKLVHEFEKQELTKKVLDSFEKYWNDTLDAFNTASNDLEKKWNDYVLDLRNMIDSYDIDEINEKIIKLENIKTFFENIPL